MKSRLRRVLRGGSWGNLPWIQRSAVRDWYNADEANAFTGFRLVGVSKDEE